MLRDALRLIQSRGEPVTVVPVDRLIEALDRLTDATVEQTRCTIEATAAIVAAGRRGSRSSGSPRRDQGSLLRAALLRRGQEVT